LVFYPGLSGSAARGEDTGMAVRGIKIRGIKIPTGFNSSNTIEHDYAMLRLS
jgi:hypothetical protein